MLASTGIFTMRDSAAAGAGQAHWRHRHRPGSYAGEGYACGWNNGTVNSPFMCRIDTASMVHPPGALPGVARRNRPEGEHYDRGSGSVSS
jgi:hypothetical protein